MKVILDTNAFYSYIGEEKLGFPSKNGRVKRVEFDHFLSISSNSIEISTITVYESLIHFRHNPKAIRLICNFILEKIDEIYFFEYLQIQKPELKQLLQNNDEQLLVEIDRLLAIKIQVEANFTATFIGFILLQFLISYIVNEKKLEFDPKKWLVLNEVLLTHITSIRRDLFTDYRNGYEKNDIERIIKHSFNHYLINEIIPLFLFLETDNIEGDFSKEVFIERLNKFLTETLVGKSIIESQQNINRFISKYNKRANYLPSNELVEIINQIASAKGISEIQIKYMNWLLDKMGRNDTAFKKNDIMDMLILNVLNDDDCIVIGWDKDLQRFLKQINNRSLSFIDVVYVKK